MAPPVCPCCGCRLDPEAPVCPECGADERTGWARAWSGEEPEEEEFDYEAYVRREFGGGDGPRLKPEGLTWFWWVVGMLVLGVLVTGWLRVW